MHTQVPNQSQSTEDLTSGVRAYSWYDKKKKKRLVVATGGDRT